MFQSLFSWIILIGSAASRCEPTDLTEFQSLFSWIMPPRPPHSFHVAI